MGEQMRALSITRPWPELILLGKNIENRTWVAGYRGPLLLHAAQSWDDTALDLIERLGVAAGMPTDPRWHPIGIVGVAELTGTCSRTVVPRDPRPGLPDPWCGCGPWAVDGQHHWQLRDPRRLKAPIQCPGRLGLWVPPSDVAAVVREQLGVTT